MMIAVRIFAIFAAIFITTLQPALGKNFPITTDNRIKTYVYSPNEVYLVTLHFGFQSSIEFDKNETIETITLGDSYALKLITLDNVLFIRPMERFVRTNATIITSRRTYQFDIVATELEKGDEKDLMYVLRFQYPKKVR